jgi:hypothetical protein
MQLMNDIEQIDKKYTYAYNVVKGQMIKNETTFRGSHPLKNPEDRDN